MVSHYRGWLLVALLLATAAYAVAEEISLVTYYPSPRGVYQVLKVGAGSTLSPPATLQVVKPADDGTLAFRVDDEGGPFEDDTPFVIDEEGNVGIGTKSPAYQLQVALPAAGANSAIGFNVTGVSGGGAILFDGSNGTPNTIVARIDGALTDGTTGAERGELAFYTKPSASGAQERMRITSGGNVGIGTASPTEPLEVSGNIKLSGATPTYRLTNVANPRVGVGSDVATQEWVEAQTGTWHGCYRKTCEVHNAASCAVAACDAGEADKGVACPRVGGLWSAQDTPTSYLAAGAGGGAMGSTLYYGDNFAADFYVTCERWCCK
ncbi:MAG: hypothetical protein HYY90_06170 [Candidatus Omnitrophica bacterium]|nr:hypothetical protein [Candidatus Omnitrophota bacterium]MBI3083933.1 hypothetical protein [Candidatus Omnitrophota bacterium]